MAWQESFGYPEQYHKDVVGACVDRSGEHNREFWDGCSYEVEFAEGMTPDECADAQIEAMQG